MTVLAAVLAFAATPPHDVCHSRACNERVAVRHCATGQLSACIERGGLHWDVSPAMLRRKAWCESRWQRFARNASGASGLFQFLPSTWRTTPYRARSVWSAKWSSLAAGWMHHVGRGGEWVCR